MANETQVRINFRGVDRTAKAVSRIDQRIQGLSRRISSGLATAFAGRQILRFGREALELFRAQNQAELKLLGTLKATEGAAGRTAEQIGEMAKQLQSVTNFGDEMIINGAAILSTFKNINDDVFDESLRLMLDMSAVMDQDLKSTAVQFGKALNDPLKGLTALSRVGVSFTEQQKEAITTAVELGDTLSAQQVILAELRGEFGGAAETMADSLIQVENMWKDVKERIGQTIAELIKFSGAADARMQRLAGMGELFDGLSLKIFKFFQIMKASIKTALMEVDALFDFFGRLDTAIRTRKFGEAFKGFENRIDRVKNNFKDAQEAIQAFSARQLEAESERASTSFKAVGEQAEETKKSIESIKDSLSDFVLAGSLRAVQRQMAGVQPAAGLGVGPQQFAPAGAMMAGDPAGVKDSLKRIATNTADTARSISRIDLEAV